MCTCDDARPCNFFFWSDSKGNLVSPQTVLLVPRQGSLTSTRLQYKGGSIRAQLSIYTISRKRTLCSTRYSCSASSTRSRAHPHYPALLLLDLPHYISRFFKMASNNLMITHVLTKKIFFLRLLMKIAFDILYLT